MLPISRLLQYIEAGGTPDVNSMRHRAFIARMVAIYDIAKIRLISHGLVRAATRIARKCRLKLKSRASHVSRSRNRPISE